MILSFFGESYASTDCKMCDHCLNSKGLPVHGPKATASAALVDMADDAALLLNAVKFCGML